MKSWKCNNCARERESLDSVELYICFACQVEMEVIKEEVIGDDRNI